MKCKQNDLTIMTEMFNITFLMEEVANEYGLRLPSLNIITADVVSGKLKRLPKTEVVETLVSAVDVYKELYTNLTGERK